MHIIDQDREKVYQVEQGSVFFVDLKEFNLFLDGGLLGTFDNKGEVYDELETILCSEESVYAVSGYSRGGEIEW